MLLGGNSADNGYSVALDPDGNMYLAGHTISTDFPLVPATNNLQTAFGGGTGDGFVAKVFPGNATLRAEHSGASDVTLRWPTGLVNFGLESTDQLLATNTWVSVTNTPVVAGSDNTVTFTDPPGSSFFRLRRNP